MILKSNIVFHTCSPFWSRLPELQFKGSCCRGYVMWYTRRLQVQAYSQWWFVLGVMCDLLHQSVVIQVNPSVCHTYFPILYSESFNAFKFSCSSCSSLFFCALYLIPSSLVSTSHEEVTSRSSNSTVLRSYILTLSLLSNSLRGSIPALWKQKSSDRPFCHWRILSYRGRTYPFLFMPISSMEMAGMEPKVRVWLTW